ncbi:MAG: peptidoglycan editing factor PgeF [Proteobacteria bacterium]|nr:peptidoglycan editing factor PgeF [Pseudomonadota bacterium]
MIPFKTSSVLDNFPFLIHGFFGRQGGTSQGFFSSLNVRYQDDDPLCVDENRRQICQTFNIKQLVTLTQIHSSYVHIVPSSSSTLVGDSLITQTPGILLGILTADCVPIFIVEPKKKIIAALHAGWKGTLSGIIENTLEEMQKLGAEHCYAALGPCIWQESFEVGQEIFNQVDQSSFFIPSSRKGFYFFDLPSFVISKLKKYGLLTIDPSPANTYKEEDRYFSYRRSTHRKEPFYGCQLSVIGLDSPK